MGILYDMRLKIDKLVEARKADPFKVKGQIGLKAGFLVGLIKPDTPDDLEKIEKLRRAVKEVLGETI